MSAANEVLRVFSDPAGAANLMREVVARPQLSAQLVEDSRGRWQVVVRPDAETDGFLARMLDLLLRSLDEGQLQFATLEFEGRTIDIGRHEATLAVG